MSRKQAPAGQKKTYRCAVYTRKSSEEGLDQTFNSLDAQREACEAYVKSQSNEGWGALTSRYDDGGYSGGSMDRPAIQRLLQHVAEGRLDIIVVYKVDRLTRSLADFAKIIEILDKHGVSFVSITQQFSTTSSMGRLTLNVLLSFSQFEREVTGERIRDKIAASKKKGMWMGGNPPLGYDIGNRKLELNAEEAEQVRAIYRRYLKLQSVATLADDCRRLGIGSKRWKTAAGKPVGGGVFSRGAIYHLLSNRTYLGEVAHRGKIYAGEHLAIVPKDLWDKVQAQLSRNRSSTLTTLRTSSDTLLKGHFFDDQGNPMSPSFTKKRNGSRYQYYVSQAILQRRPGAAVSVPRISAPAIESFITEQITGHLTDSSRAALETLPAHERSSRLRAMLRRVELADKEVTITLLKRDESAAPRLNLKHRAGNSGTDGQAETVTIKAPILLRSWAGKAFIEGPGGQGRQQPRMDHALIRAIARAHRWKDALLVGSAKSLDDLASKDGCTSQYVRQILKLASLAPELVEAILMGRQPIGLRLTTLAQTALPLSWHEQRRALSWPATR